MLKQQLTDCTFYKFVNEDFKVAFDFLKNKENEKLDAGRYDINDRFFAFVQIYHTKPEDQVKWEAHNKYFDIQYIVSGEEKFYIAQRDNLNETVPYDETKDIVFFGETDGHADLVILKQGEFVIVGPEEAHKPCCTVRESQWVKKIVVKVPVRN